MNIGTFSTIGGNTSYNQLGHDYIEQIPAGDLITDTKAEAGSSFNLPFSRDEAKYRQKRNYPVIPEILGHYHDTKYKVTELTQKNPTITVFNNLQNYNPTQGITYFHPHETDKLLHHNISRPRMESEKYYNIDTVKEIEEKRKKQAPLEDTLPEHSFTIKRRYRT